MFCMPPLKLFLLGHPLSTVCGPAAVQSIHALLRLNGVLRVFGMRIPAGAVYRVLNATSRCRKEDVDLYQVQCP